MTEVSIGKQMIDITQPELAVEVQIGPEAGLGQVLWVNVDGLCRLRICQISPEVKISIDDKRLRHRNLGGLAY